MSNTHENLSSLFTDIADKLRDKNNTNDEYVADNFPSEIDKLEKINNSQVVKSIAKDKIQIGDTVYTVNASPYDLESGRGHSPLDVCYAAAFSPDGSVLVLNVQSASFRFLRTYSVNGTIITPVSLDTNGIEANSLIFSPSGDALIAVANYKACVYSVNGTTITYVGNIYADNNETALEYVYTATFSPDGNTLVLGGEFEGFAKVYSVDGTTITYVRDMYADNKGTALDGGVFSAAFSPVDNTLILGGIFSYGLIRYRSLYDPSPLHADRTGSTFSERGEEVYALTFSPDGNVLVVGGGEFPGFAKVYSVDRDSTGVRYDYVDELYIDSSGTELGCVYSLAFSPDGSILVLGEDDESRIFSVNSTTLTYISDIYADNNETPFDDYVKTITFSSNGNVLILCGGFTGKAKAYSVEGSVINYIDDMYSFIPDRTDDNTYFGYKDNVEAVAFSPDGKTLVLGGSFCSINSNYFDNSAKIYSVNGTTITYVSDIYADNNGTMLVYVESAIFSPDGTTLVLGGRFSGFAKVYSVDGTTITYVSDIYADNNGINLSGMVKTAAFSPDGKTLVLGGDFADKAKVYSVDGTTITYVSDIYASPGGSEISDTVYAAAFSPDGNTLVLGGRISGYGVVYSVNGTTITPASVIYVNNKGGTTYTATFSPDGNTLVLCGDSYAKIFSVNGTTITYVSDIYADGSGTALQNCPQSTAFSPDGNILVLVGGYFPGYAKVYSVNGTTITYVNDIEGGAIASESGTIAFSPNGNILVLCHAAASSQTSKQAIAYTVLNNSIQYSDKGVYLAPNGLFADLPYGANLGFAKSDAEVDNEVTVKTIGTYAPIHTTIVEISN